MIGAATIGNATVIAYDGGPILATDPWFGDEDPAYFGSWVTSHEIPAEYKEDILEAKFLFFSHGHPDHLNPISIGRFKGKTILLPDHVGGRISQALKEEGYEIRILPDRKWVELSKNVRVQCITTVAQDAVLLLDINGTLFVDLNDAGTKHCTAYVRKLTSQFKKSYMLALSGYGDADMINFYDEAGDFVVPPARNSSYVGEQLSLIGKSIGVQAVIPFSSFHQYQRTDSIWAQKYTTPESAYDKGMDPGMEFVPAFSRVDCVSGETIPIRPKSLPLALKPPEEFGDNWTDELTKEDAELLRKYFDRKARVKRYLSFINFRVGGKDNIISLDGKQDKGMTFAVPRTSLMTAIGYEIFDDLLIGNFMKTTLHNMQNLYEGEINFAITKYADNGRAETEEQVREYLAEYRRRCGREWIYDRFLENSKSIGIRLLPLSHNSAAFRFAKRLFYSMK